MVVELSRLKLTVHFDSVFKLFSSFFSSVGAPLFQNRLDWFGVKGHLCDRIFAYRNPKLLSVFRAGPTCFGA